MTALTPAAIRNAITHDPGAWDHLIPDAQRLLDYLGWSDRLPKKHVLHVGWSTTVPITSESPLRQLVSEKVAAELIERGINLDAPDTGVLRVSQPYDIPYWDGVTPLEWAIIQVSQLHPLYHIATTAH